MYPRKSVIDINITHVTQQEYENMLEDMYLYVPLWILTCDWIEMEHVHWLIKNILRHFISIQE